MKPVPPELDDIQGLLRFGYKHLTQAAFLLLRIKDRGAARDWLASAPVTSAVTQQPPPDTALHVALSSDGLRALGVADDVIDGFSPEFRVGLGNDTSRARRLGDVGPSAPPLWQWGAGQRVPHVLVLLYARPGALDAWQQVVQAQFSAGFALMACLPTADMDGVEPFGFIDGISQPELDWERRRPVLDAEQVDYSNRACLGEFLLGYPNEYAGYTDRPLLHPAREGARVLPRAEEAPDQADLGRNGSYLVLRQLQQDVHGFWQFLDRQVNGDAGRRQRLAERMVGRTLQGQPLVGDAGTPNAFTYDADPDGLRCPLGAHIRRSNPRNADLPPGGDGLVSRLVRTLGFDAAALQQDRVASTRFHRLLRRGREYGVQVPLAQALAARPVGSGDVSGLHFISLGASIARQFEFVQGAWLAGTRFDGLAESDPLLGPRVPGLDGAATDMFSIPQANGPTRRVSGLPHFVTVRGGGYFFLPGLRALRYLATA